jgi:hypothetical protein
VIFAFEFPDTEFISIGNHIEVVNDRLEIAKSIETLIRGVKIVKLIDRDDRTDLEIKSEGKNGVRVLSKRHLEAFLFDDEILTLLCQSKGLPEKVSDVLAIKAEALNESIARGNAIDDVKSAAGKIYTEVKRALGLTQCGNDTASFQRETLARLVTTDTQTYRTLRNDIFG